MGTSRTRETKYNKTVDLYWQMKTMMGKVLVEKNESYNEILIQLDDMQLQIKEVDYKVSVLPQ